MTYKTILVHCNDTRRIGKLLAPAVRLAEAFQAHLTGLSVVPPAAVVTAGMPGAPPMVIDAHCEIYRQENPDLRAAFEEAARGRGFVAEWRDEDAAASGVPDCVLPHARAADLVVASQAAGDWPSSKWLDIADTLVLESGRPVLIVPNAGGCGTVGEKVLVAWNGRREAARAAFDAVPILQRARSVRVVRVDRHPEQEPPEELPAADICAALSRHGVKCEAAERLQRRGGAGGAGETLLACAREHDADLLVMGCYGHTRFREFVFGGASRYVLAHMPIPVLMSH